MKNLLYKEIRLAMHPMALAFLALSAMLLIPNYPYYVIFFYTSLGVFFICLTGRENRDIFYTLSLPVNKRDVVSARMLTVVLLELAQLLTAGVFAAIKSALPIPPNVVGIDANITFFGSSLAMLGLFNLVFFGSYYKAPDKVGTAFLKGCIAEAVYMIIAEMLVHAVPFARDVLDTPDPQGMGAKLIALAVGALLFIGLTALAWKKAMDSFEKLDF